MDAGELVLVPLLLGLLSAFSPCLFPLLPSYVAMTLRSEQNRFMILLSSLSLITGVMVIFLAIGQFLNFVGSFLLTRYTLFARIQGGLLIVAGILLIYTPSFVQQITVPQRFQDFLYGGEERNPLFFGFAIGLLFTIIAVPCAAGYFFAVWNIMLGEPLSSQLFIVLSFGMGVGVPFILMALFLPELRGEMVSRMHEATERIGQVLGVVLILVGIWLILSISPTNIPAIT